MQLFDVYPAGAVGGSCFVTKDYQTGPGSVVSLDVRLENLPAHGLLCVSKEGVRQMNVILGWVADEDGHARLLAAQDRVAELEAENATIRESYQNFVASTSGFITTPAEPIEVVVTQDVADAIQAPAAEWKSGRQGEHPEKAPAKKAAAKKAPAKPK